jgi:hypothetical protein
MAKSPSARSARAAKNGKSGARPAAAKSPEPRRGKRRTAPPSSVENRQTPGRPSAARAAHSVFGSLKAHATAVGRVDSDRAQPESAVLAQAPAATEVSGKGRYVYCIIRSDQPLHFGPIGIGDEPAPVYTVCYENLSAVVSDAPLEVLDPTRDNVLAHQRVNETVMRKHTVLPMSFGTVFKTRDDVTAFLKAAYRAFSDVLDKMENKLEFGLKVLWDRDAVIRQIEEEDEDIHRLKSEIASQKGSTYFARMQYGRLIDAALQARSERYVAEIFERLRDVSVAARANKPIGDRMILNAAFLVSRDAEEAFDARVKELGAEHDKLTFKYTGPWPPYNFVNIRLKLERA